jgi:hypothetical protein
VVFYVHSKYVSMLHQLWFCVLASISVYYMCHLHICKLDIISAMFLNRRCWSVGWRGRWVLENKKFSDW